MTYEECKKTIAVKYQLGTTLVTGHRASYFEEAAILYASKQAKEQWNAAIEKAAESAEVNLQGEHKINAGVWWERKGISIKKQSILKLKKP